MLIPNWRPVRAICIKFPAVRLINFLKISKGRGSCRKLIVTIAILLWIIFLFNILCSTWFSLCCLPRLFFFFLVICSFFFVLMLFPCETVSSAGSTIYGPFLGGEMVKGWEDQLFGFLYFDLIAYSSY